MTPLDDDRLREEIIRLGPWHHDIEVRPGLTTRVSEDVEYPKSFGNVSMLDWRRLFVKRMLSVYPDGLAGRSVMDCSCNCGECLFWAKELGAGRCFGSDVREHWINQARFLLEHREGPKDDIRVEVSDLYDLPDLDLEPFDVGLFHGVFYHLPDPIHGLKIAADLTKELLVVTTATHHGHPDGYLKLGQEGTKAVLSGVHGLQWLPTGPQAVTGILASLGFPAARVTRYKSPSGKPGRGRLDLLAARDGAVFEEFDARAARRKERTASQ
jgi:SAM-dependent methyltransferase